MLIDRIDLQIVRVTLLEPFRISSGVTHTRRILLVRLVCDGVIGYGECVADDEPYYSPETVDTACWIMEHHLIAAVLGRHFDTASEVAHALERAARGHPMAKAAIEMAAWDLEARLRGVTLAALLGGVRDAVPSGVSIGIQEDEDALFEQVERYVGEGYRRIKLKIAPGWDAHIIERVRERFPALPLSVDANAAYQAVDAERLAALDRFGLVMLEQPYADDELLALSALQGMMQTPICLDETVTSPARCAEALHLSAGRIVNIKPGRVGGHTSARRIHDLCAAAGVPVWCGGMLETGIGRAHNIALATLPNFTMPNDISASRRYWARDIIASEFVLGSDGMIALPGGTGIGVEVDEEYLSSVEESCRSFEPRAP
jgi:O-succinylbenzoate synthase